MGFTVISTYKGPFGRASAVAVATLLKWFL
jgi:hypothetical protein